MSETIGPADPKAPARAKLYASLAFITPVLSALSAFNIITTTQGSAVATFLSAAIGLLGAFGFGLAATKTSTQVKDGTFDAPPRQPASTVIEQLNEIKTEVDKTVQHAQSQLADGVAAIQGITSLLPGGQVVGGLTNAVLSGPVGDLIQAMSDRGDDARRASNALHRREE